MTGLYTKVNVSEKKNTALVNYELCGDNFRMLHIFIHKYTSEDPGP